MDAFLTKIMTSRRITKKNITWERRYLKGDNVVVWNMEQKAACGQWAGVSVRVSLFRASPAHCAFALRKARKSLREFVRRANSHV